MNKASGSKSVQVTAADDRGGGRKDNKVGGRGRDRPRRHHAYLRRGLGDGGPGCSPASRLCFMVHSDLRGGGRGAIWWR
jgi:hypothetical protein